MPLPFVESGCQTDLTAASIDALEKEVLQLNAEILAAKIKIEPVEVAPDLARDQNQQVQFQTGALFFLALTSLVQALSNILRKFKRVVDFSAF